MAEIEAEEAEHAEPTFCFGVRSQAAHDMAASPANNNRPGNQPIEVVTLESPPIEVVTLENTPETQEDTQQPTTTGDKRENPGKTGKGRPKGSKDKQPRKKRSMKATAQEQFEEARRVFHTEEKARATAAAEQCGEANVTESSTTKSPRPKCKKIESTTLSKETPARGGSDGETGLAGKKATTLAEETPAKDGGDDGAGPTVQQVRGTAIDDALRESGVVAETKEDDWTSR